MKCDDSLAILTKEKEEDMENEINVIGKISSSQDSVVVDADGIAPTHTSGHGNCPKIAEPMIVDYSRDEKGKVVGRHLKETANTELTELVYLTEKKLYIWLRRQAGFLNLWGIYLNG